MHWAAVVIALLAAAAAAWRVPQRLRVRVPLVTLPLLVAAGFLLTQLLAPPHRAVLSGIVVLLAVAFLSGMLLVVVGRWRSDRAEVERLRGLARGFADQVSVLSHEIRTPLALMRGSADLLIEGTPGPLTPRQYRYLETIHRNCGTVISLAEDLLTQAKIDAGMFELHPQAVRLQPLVRGVVQELRTIHPGPIALDSPGAPAQVWADPALLQQVLINLVNNAVAHARGAQLITVRIVTREEKVLISVSDDGEGMDERERRTLFEKFASGRPDGGGTGLGMVISRQIVAMHGGRLMVDSVSGGGTTMMVSLPSRSDPWAPDETHARGED